MLHLTVWGTWLGSMFYTTFVAGAKAQRCSPCTHMLQVS